MRKGFTLIELLIVVAIIAILAAIAVPNFLEAQTRAKVSRSKADMRSLATGIESYVVDNNVYPPLTARTSQRFGGPTPNSILNGPSVFHAGTPGVSSRYIWITTPVAYITSVFMDPFISNSVRFALNAGDGTPNLEYDTYDYIDARTSTPAQGDPVWTTAYRGASICSGASWHIVGCGPDKMNAFGGNRNNNGTPLSRSRGFDYDPTNGTISAGDLVRIGGSPGPLFATGGKPSIDRVANRFYIDGAGNPVP